jgi:hypothetical protein
MYTVAFEAIPSTPKEVKLIILTSAQTLLLLEVNYDSSNIAITYS